MARSPRRSTKPQIGRARHRGVVDRARLVFGQLDHIVERASRPMRAGATTIPPRTTLFVRRDDPVRGLVQSRREANCRTVDEIGKSLAGAPGRNRTSTVLPPPDFESGASTNSATGAGGRDYSGGGRGVNAVLKRAFDRRRQACSGCATSSDPHDPLTAYRVDRPSEPVCRGGRQIGE